MSEDSNTIRYIALGDSYTAGEGLSRRESWPALLVRDLQNAGMKIELIANLAKTGWLTQHLIELELPLLEKHSASFVSLQIGANDWVQGMSPEKFHSNLEFILDKIQTVLPDRKKILLVTIPDFSVTHIGEIFGEGRSISEGIARFNDLIFDEGKRRSLVVADIFKISQEMKGSPDLVGEDGLHPSAKEYELWEKEIFPAALGLLKI